MKTQKRSFHLFGLFALLITTALFTVYFSVFAASPTAKTKTATAGPTISFEKVVSTEVKTTLLGAPWSTELLSFSLTAPANDDIVLSRFSPVFTLSAGSLSKDPLGVITNAVFLSEGNIIAQTMMMTKIKGQINYYETSFKPQGSFTIPKGKTVKFSVVVDTAAQDIFSGVGIKGMIVDSFVTGGKAFEVKSATTGKVLAVSGVPKNVLTAFKGPAYIGSLNVPSVFVGANSPKGGVSKSFEQVVAKLVVSAANTPGNTALVVNSLAPRIFTNISFAKNQTRAFKIYRGNQLSSSNLLGEANLSSCDSSSSMKGCRLEIKFNNPSMIEPGTMQTFTFVANTTDAKWDDFLYIKLDKNLGMGWTDGVTRNNSIPNTLDFGMLKY